MRMNEIGDQRSHENLTLGLSTHLQERYKRSSPECSKSVGSGAAQGLLLLLSEGTQ